MSDTQYKMSQRVAQYDGAQVYTEGSDRVTIEIPGADDAEEILNELGKPGAVYFILQYGSDGKTANYSGNSLYGYKLEIIIVKVVPVPVSCSQPIVIKRKAE